MSSTLVLICNTYRGELITLDEMERRYVRQVLSAVGGNKTHAARILGIDRRSLYRRLEEPRHEQKPAEAGGAPARAGSPSTPPPVASNGHTSSGSSSGPGGSATHPGEIEQT